MNKLVFGLIRICPRCDGKGIEALTDSQRKKKREPLPCKRCQGEGTVPYP